MFSACFFLFCVIELKSLSELIEIPGQVLYYSERIFKYKALFPFINICFRVTLLRYFSSAYTLNHEVMFFNFCNINMMHKLLCCINNNFVAYKFLLCTDVCFYLCRLSLVCCWQVPGQPAGFLLFCLSVLCLCFLLKIIC